MNASMYDSPAETDLDAGNGAFEPYLADPQSMYRSKSTAMGLMNSTGRKAPRLGAGGGRPVASGDNKIVGDLLKEQDKVKVPTPKYDQEPQAEAEATSAHATANPTEDGMTTGSFKRNFFAAVAPLFQDNEHEVKTNANVATPISPLKFEADHSKDAAAQKHARGDRPDWSEYDRAAKAYDEELARYASGEADQESTGTRIGRAIPFVKDFMPKKQSSAERLQALYLQKNTAKERAVEKYLRDHPEAGEKDDPYTLSPGQVRMHGGKVVATNPNKAHENAAHYVETEEGVVDISGLPRSEGGDVLQPKQIPNPTLAPNFVGPSVPGTPQTVTGYTKVKPAHKEPTEKRTKNQIIPDESGALVNVRTDEDGNVISSTPVKGVKKQSATAKADTENFDKALARYHRLKDDNDKLMTGDPAKRSPKSIQNEVEKEAGLNEGELLSGRPHPSKPAGKAGEWEVAPDGKTRVRVLPKK